MRLQAEQILRVKNCEPGWEQDWSEICELLVAHLRRVCPRLPGVRWPDEDSCDEFVGEMLLDYQRRAQAGTLLVGFEPTGNDAGVLAYVAAPSFLAKRARGFLRRPSFWPVQLSVLMERSDGGPGEVADSRPTVSPGMEREDRWRTITDALDHPELAVPPRGRIGRVVEQAGLQLHPRLEWRQETLQRLRAHLLSVLVDPSPAWQDRFAMLDHFHAQDRAVLLRQMDQKESGRYNQGRGVSPRKDERLCRQLQRLWLEQALYPLGAESLMRLLDITRADSDQRRSRYRKSIPGLLPRLRELCAGAGISLGPDEGVEEEE